jgi:hypothetical protein
MHAGGGSTPAMRARMNGRSVLQCTAIVMGGKYTIGHEVAVEIGIENILVIDILDVTIRDTKKVEGMSDTTMMISNTIMVIDGLTAMSDGNKTKQFKEEKTHRAHLTLRRPRQYLCLPNLLQEVTISR